MHREGCCRPCAKPLRPCIAAARQVGFPKSAAMCEQNYAYYGTTENMLRHRIARVRDEEARARRRGFRQSCKSTPSRVHRVAVGGPEGF